MAYGVLNAKISAQVDEFERNMDRASGKLDDVGNAGERGGTKASKGLATLAKAAGIAAVAIGVVIKKTSDMVIAVAGATDRVDKMSQKIGISRQSFQEWDFILSQSGARVDGLQASMKALATQAEASDRGVADSANMFKKLGVDIYDANGQIKEQETLFEETFKALADYGNEAERTAMASKLLGRAGTELIPAMNGGAEAIDAMRKQAHDLGLVMDDDLIDKGVVLTDNVDKLKRAYQAWKNEALQPLVELAVSFTDAILDQNTNVTKLEKNTRNLTTQSSLYKSIISQLEDPVVLLTDAEKARLGILKEIQAQNLEDTIYQTSRAYKQSANEVRKAKKALEELESKQDAYTLVIGNYSEAQRRLSELSSKKNRTTREELDLANLTTAMMDTAFQRQTEMLTLGDKVGEQREKANALNKSYASSIEAIARAVADGTIDVGQYALTNVDFYNAVMNSVWAMENQAKGIKIANERLADLNLTTERAVQYQIDYYESIRDGYTDEMNSAMITRLLNQLYERKAEILAENAKKTEDANEKDRLRNEILENANTAIQTAEQYAKALGDTFDLNAEKASIFESAIKALIDSGLDPASDEVQGLIDKLTALGSAMETPEGDDGGDEDDTGTYYEDELDRIREFLSSEQDLLLKRYTDRQALLNEALSKEKVSKQEHDELMKELETQYQQDLTNIQKKSQEERNQLMLSAGTMMANNLISIYSNLVDATEKEGKRNFQLQKAASIAQAVVDGISAGISSYKTGAAIGGPVVGAAFAATSAAATGAMIAKLASASYGGGSSASVPTPSTTTPAVQSQQTLLVQGDFDSSQLFSGSAVRDLIDKIGEAQKDGYTVVMA